MALEECCKKLRLVKQSRQHAHISDMMGTPVPFLPFCGNEIENKCFLKYVRKHNGPINDETAAVEWCQYVDEVNNNAKSASQIQTHMTSNEPNQHIKENKKTNKVGSELLTDLHRTIRPVLIAADTDKQAEPSITVPDKEPLSPDPATSEMLSGPTYVLTTPKLPTRIPDVLLQALNVSQSRGTLIKSVLVNNSA